MNKRLKKWRNRGIFVLVAAAAVTAFILIRNNYTLYDYSHLTPRADYGAGGGAFVPLPGAEPLDDSEQWLAAADSASLTLYINAVDSNIAVRDKRGGYVWYSCPPSADDDQLTNAYERDVMRSMAGFKYYDSVRRRYSKWSYADAAGDGQFTLENIPNGVRVIYEVGDLSLGLDACPRYLTEERFQQRVLDMLEDEADQKFIARMYYQSREKEGFWEMVGGVRDHRINTGKVIDIFEKIGYTLEELVEDNEAAEYEMDISFDTFGMRMEFALRDDTLTVNFPLSGFEAGDENKIYFLELMKYFGAGGADEQGYILVPSGSGALMEFNNGKVNEDLYAGSVYGLDPMMNLWLPQQLNSTRLPLLGIKRENAAVLCYIENGAALATVNASNSGRNSSYNAAWFTFLLRDNIVMQLAAGADNDMTVVQQQAYDGDITLKYCFLAGEQADYTGMALAYQRMLVEKGALTPLAAAGNAPFYLDIVGAAEKRKFVLGTPYKAMESMTTYKQAGEILTQLNESGVHAVQMRWLGWFNRGINHDVAKKIDWINSNGSRKDMQALNDRLQADGGGLFPAVNFQLTSYFSKNFNKTYEVSRDPAGYIGFASDYRREYLNFMGGPGITDWFLFVSPIALPSHIEKFIPAYNKLALDNLALADLGDVLDGSIYRKDSADRENSRLIVAEQLGILRNAYDNIMVSGGNAYSLAAASHITEAPLAMDRHYILDHEVPFYQIVIHGYIDYAGAPVNAREVQDIRDTFLTSMATGAAPHYIWTHTPTRSLEFSPYERFYSTQYGIWFDDAVRQYNEYNAVYKNLRTERITGHAVLSESSRRAAAVTVTEYENGTRVYVNNTASVFVYGGVTIPARGYYVEQ